MRRKPSSHVVGWSSFRKVAMSTPLVRDLAWRFVAGENLDSGIAAIRSLNDRGIAGTLNYVGAHAASADDATAAADAVVESLRRIHEAGLQSHVSLKLTQIGLDINEELCRSQLRKVLDVATQLRIFVRIDMEESAYTERTISLFEETRREYGAGCVGIALQSYLRGRRADLGRLLAGGSRIRIVKGGYWEPADVVYRSRSDIDAAFRDDVRQLLHSGVNPAIATHDAGVIGFVRGVAGALELDRRAFEFQMLYGVRRDMQDALVRDGYAVRCYVPYGSHWFEYVLGCARRVPAGAFRRVGERVRPRPGVVASAAFPSNGSRPRTAALGHRRSRVVKRGLDVIGAIAGSVVLSPVLAWTALAVLISQGRPVLFRSERSGIAGRPFTMLKFRTMRPPRPGEVWFETDSQRVTRLGRILRSTSIDELPELWNVLRGDMSLVGPRPLLPEYDAHYTARERRRLDMRPGITGWAAVNGRHALRFEERLELDAWYVDNWSLHLDVRILLMTVSQVLRRTDVSSTQSLAEIGFPSRFRTALAQGRAAGSEASQGR